MRICLITLWVSLVGIGLTYADEFGQILKNVGKSEVKVQCAEGMDILLKTDDSQFSDKDRVLHLLDKAFCLGILGRDKEAMQTFDQALAMNIWTNRVLATKAILLREIRRWQESLDTYQAILNRSDVSDVDRAQIKDEMQGIVQKIEYENAGQKR